jgi:hypothetical protein
MSMLNGKEYPRELTANERDLLLWVLPADRRGYQEYRELVQQWKVVAQGRRGEGNYILAAAGEHADLDSPLSHVVAYGMVEMESGELSVSVRERVQNQIEYEILAVRGSVDVGVGREIRRWSLSSWQPGSSCPQCGRAVREVPITSAIGQTVVLALCAYDRRLWLYDGQRGVNLPIPVSNFYNELMLHKNIRDPNIAFDFKRLFSDLHTFSDADLRRAFRSYNKIRTKVVLESDVVVEAQRPPFLKRLMNVLRGHTW